MKYSDLPKSQFVGFATDPDTLEAFLSITLFKPGPFIYCERAVDGPRSCRVLFQEMVVPYVETRPLDQPHSALAIAHQFFHTGFVPQVRRTPPRSAHSEPGWEVRQANNKNHSITIVLAAWDDEFWSLLTLFEATCLKPCGFLFYLIKSWINRTNHLWHHCTLTIEWI